MHWWPKMIWFDTTSDEYQADTLWEFESSKEVAYLVWRKS